MTEHTAETHWMSLEQDAIYWRLLQLLWSQSGCKIPNDIKWIANRIRVDGSKYGPMIQDILDEFFVTRRTEITHRRLHESWLAYFDRSNAAKINGSKGGKSKALKDKRKHAGKGHGKQLAVTKDLEEVSEELEESEEDNIVRITPRTSEESINEFRRRNRL